MQDANFQLKLLKAKLARVFQDNIV